MRASFLLALLPLVAFADASTPDKRSAPTSFTVGDRAVTVGWGDDGEIHVRVKGGGDLLLKPAGRAYVSEDGLTFHAELAANVAPVPLLKVSSRPEACGDYWDIYVSVVDGVAREALALYGLADPPSMSSSTAKFAGDTVVVTTRTAEDETHTRTKRTRYRWNGTVYVESKQAPAKSK